MIFLKLLFPCVGQQHNLQKRKTDADACLRENIVLLLGELISGMTRGKEFHSHTNGYVNRRSTPYNNVSVSPLPFSSPLSPGPSFFDPFHCREGKERGLLWLVVFAQLLLHLESITVVIIT